MTEIVSQRLVYLDSNVFIYYVEGESSVADPLQDLFPILRNRPGLAVTSELTLAEVLATPQRAGAMPLHLKRELYLDLIVENRTIHLEPVSRDVLYETAELRRNSRHHLPDAIHIVTAALSGCTYFMSSDHDAKRLPLGMRRLEANKAGVQELIEHLNV